MSMDRKGTPVGRGFLDLANADPKRRIGEIGLRAGISTPLATGLGPVYNIVPADNPFYVGGPNLNIIETATEDAVRYELLSIAVNPSTGTIVASPNSSLGSSCYRSTDDGATWSNTTGTAARGYLAYFNGAFWNKPIGGTTLHRSTDDGATWSQVVGSVSPFPTIINSLRVVNGNLCWTGGTTSGSAYVGISADGLSWTYYTMPSTGEGTGLGPRANGIAYGNSIWVASRDVTTKTFAYSSTLPTWLNGDAAIGPQTNIGIVLWDGEKFVSRNSASTATSADLATVRTMLGPPGVSETTGPEGVYKDSALASDGTPVWLSSAWYSGSTKYSENFLLRGTDDIFTFGQSTYRVSGMCLHDGSAYIAGASTTVLSSPTRSMRFIKLSNVYVP